MKRIIFGAVTVVAFLSLAAAGCDRVQNVPATQDNVVNNTAATMQVPPKAALGQDVYTNAENGFSVVVPGGYAVQQEGAVFFFATTGAESSAPLPSLSVLTDTTVTAAIAQLTAADAGVRISKTEATQCDNRNATTVTYDTPVGVTYRAVYVANGQRVYILREVVGGSASILAELQSTLHLL